MQNPPPSALPFAQVDAGVEHAELDLEHFLPYRLSVLSNRVSQAIARIYAQRFSLTVTEWRLMAVLGRFPGLTAAELVERSAMDKVAVSRAVARLLESGRISRGNDQHDRRRAPLELSNNGYRVYDEVAPLALAFEASLLGSLSAAEQALLHDLLGRLAARVEAAETALSPRPAAARTPADPSAG